MTETPVPGNAQLDRFEIHKRFKIRLDRTFGIVEIEPRPSAMRPIRLRATVDTQRFLDETYTPDAALLEVEWRPRGDRDAFRIQYTEPASSWSCGWHQDADHDDLGASHFQVDHSEWDSSYREPASFEDPNPMAVLETCLDELETRVPALPDSVR